ncbi:Gag protein [Phytophthora palmivora]|uniref:Gag protein n=1 Tax=Phytophthora palmivora TaxID=4796 RepID=A0A2P4XH27_9STRA|nr:Gag protein [Phytophthora palmivora]
MVGIFGGDAGRADRTHLGVRHGLQAPVAEMKPAQPKPLRLKVNLYEGKEGENLHFWVREVELAMDAALISTERLRVAFALSNLEGRAKTGAYTREATTPGCFITWAQFCQKLLNILISAANVPSSLEPPSSRRATSIASARASLPVNKGSVSCMSTFRRCEYSLHLW